MKSKVNPNPTTVARYFHIQDYMLVAALLSNNKEPAMVTKGRDGAKYFVYRDAPAVNRLVRKYYKGTLKVNVDYHDRVIDLHHEPYDW